MIAFLHMKTTRFRIISLKSSGKSSLSCYSTDLLTHFRSETFIVVKQNRLVKIMHDSLVYSLDASTVLQNFVFANN